MYECKKILLVTIAHLNDKIGISQYVEGAMNNSTASTMPEEEVERLLAQVRIVEWSTVEECLYNLLRSLHR